LNIFIESKNRHLKMIFRDDMDNCVTKLSPWPLFIKTLLKLAQIFCSVLKTHPQQWSIYLRQRFYQGTYQVQQTHLDTFEKSPSRLPPRSVWPLAAGHHEESRIRVHVPHGVLFCSRHSRKEFFK
jgi:hypothetical protein